jgi:23S rRNA (cytidine1920-2'-O)/16S rRNA (cytidine1409-2'-O)-methyltransferase
MNPPKKRLDILVVENGIAETRQRACAMIMAGKILINGYPGEKPGTQVPATADISSRGEDIPYVSRGGIKLASALAEFGTDPTGLVCLDVGASTGGFTDCLLQKGAKSVISVDVGYGQLAWKLRNDPRVLVMERCNIRHLSPDTVSAAVDLVTIDVSFISLKIVIPSILKLIRQDAVIIALIKPQFEVGKGMVGKGGVVRDPLQHDAVIGELSLFFEQQNLGVRSVIPSPIKGPKGNKEFFILLDCIFSLIF